MALEQLQGQGVGGLGGRGCGAAAQRSGATPATTVRPRPAGRAAGRGAPGAGPGGASGPRRTRRPAAPRRPASRGPQRGERVVGDLAGPHQVPQRAEHRGVVVGQRRPSAHGRHQVGPERGAPLADSGRGARRAAVRSDGRDRRRRPTAAVGVRATSRAGAWSRKQQAHPAVGGAERPGADPHHLARGAQRVEVGRAVAADPGAAARRARGRRRAGPPPAASRPPRPGRRAPPVRHADALPRGQEAGEGGGSTGSTSRRSAASERRRSWRSTSASHHSRSMPPGRNSPRTTRPCRSSARAPASTPLDAASAEAARRPRRPGTARGCGRSGRRGRERRRATGSVKAVGSPAGRATPSASRSRAASSAAATRSSPATATRMARRSATSSSTQARRPASGPARPRDLDRPQREGPEHAEQVVHLVGVAGPAAVGRGAAARARGRPARSGSSSSRSSSAPSSSRSRSRSRASAAARRSASGASPSYM